MEIAIKLVDLFTLSCSILCMLVALMLVLFPRPFSTPNWFLGFSFFCISMALFVSFCVSTRILYEMPHMYRTGAIFAYLYMPFSYLYMRHVFEGENPGKKAILHMLPALIYIVDFLPFFFSSRSTKLLLLERDLLNVQNVLRFSEGWLLPDYFHYVVRYFLMAFYSFLQIRLLVKFHKLKNDPEKAKDFRPLWNWLVLLSGLQIVIWLPSLLVFSLGKTGNIWGIAEFTAAIAAFVTAIFLFFEPQVLYGSAVILNNTPGRPPMEPTISMPHAESRISDELAEKLEAHMMSNAPYLRHGYSLHDLADELNVPVYVLSSHINKYSGMNFNDYLNKFRIDYCTKLIDGEEGKLFKLETLASICGFSNRNSFTTAFKKFVGETPSSYVKAKRQNKTG